MEEKPRHHHPSIKFHYFLFNLLNWIFRIAEGIKFEIRWDGIEAKVMKIDLNWKFDTVYCTFENDFCWFTHAQFHSVYFFQIELQQKCVKIFNFHCTNDYTHSVFLSFSINRNTNRSTFRFGALILYGVAMSENRFAACRSARHNNTMTESFMQSTSSESHTHTQIILSYT